jgi:hypothetical protein
VSYSSAAGGVRCIIAWLVPLLLSATTHAAYTCRIPSLLRWSSWPAVQDYGFSQLHQAAWDGELDDVRKLIADGAKLEAKDKSKGEFERLLVACGQDYGRGIHAR